MAIRRNKYLGGSAGSGLAGIWTLYSSFTTAKDLPEDAGWVAKMMADPPFYAPWLLLAACIGFLTWVFWHRDEPDTGNNDPLISQATKGDGSHAIVNHGTINMGSAAPAATQPLKSPYGYDIEKLTDGKLERAIRRAHLHPSIQPGLARFESNPLPNIPLNGVLSRVYKILGAPKDSAKREDFRRRVNRELADKVCLHHMSVWGRLGDRALTLLPPEQLSAGQFDHIGKSFTTTNASAWPITYVDLKFSKNEVDRIWPEPLRTTNDDKP